MSFETLFIIAIATGIFGSLITLTYQIGDNHRIHPCHIALFMGAAGMVVFFLHAASLREPSALSAPPSVWVLGFVAGVTQGLTILLLRLSFSRGPYSPVLVALRMMFVVVAIYSVVFLSEKLSTLQYAGILVSIACVVASVYTKTSRLPSRAGEATLFDRLLFLLLLIGIILTQAITGIAMKYLSATPWDETHSLLMRFDPVFLFMLYLGFTLTVIVESVRVGKPGGRLSTLVLLGLAASFGSVTTLKGFGVSSALPAGLNFVISSVTAILASAITSAMFFGDRRNLAWYATIAFAVIAALLMNVKLDSIP